MTKKNQEILKIGQITFYTLERSEKWSNYFFDTMAPAPQKGDFCPKTIVSQKWAEMGKKLVKSDPSPIIVYPCH